MSDREIMDSKGFGKKQSIIKPEFHHMFGRRFTGTKSKQQVIDFYNG
jgi:hypothetical protein